MYVWRAVAFGYTLDPCHGSRIREMTVAGLNSAGGFAQPRSPTYGGASPKHGRRQLDPRGRFSTSWRHPTQLDTVQRAFSLAAPSLRSQLLWADAARRVGPTRSARPPSSS